MLDEWIVEAIDFHCDKNIVIFIQKKFNYKKNVIEKIIWHNNSKTNFRIKQKTLYHSQYIIIKKYLRRLQIYLLQSNY